MLPSTVALGLGLILDLVLVLPTVLAQSACSFAQDGTTPTGSGACNCFESQEPKGWIVDCSGLSLTSVPSGLPAETAYLYLRGNSITELPSSSFEGISSLETLHIQNNGLRSDLIEDGTFSNLTNLKSLDLSGNRIVLSANMIQHLLPLTRLQTLTLTNNNINTIDSSAVEIFDRLETLDLTSNAFVCDCELSWFRNWLLNTVHINHQINGATCSSPPRYQREDIDRAEFCPSSVCVSCNGGSNVECNSQSNFIQTCSSSQGACFNEIRVSNGVYNIQKSCKQLRACLNQVSSNVRECNEGTTNSVCRTCCLGDLCNSPASGVIAGYTLPGFPRDPSLVVETTTPAPVKSTAAETTAVSTTPTESTRTPLSPRTTLVPNSTRPTTPKGVPTTPSTSVGSTSSDPTSESSIATTNAVTSSTSNPHAASTASVSVDQDSSSASVTTPSTAGSYSTSFTTSTGRPTSTAVLVPHCPEETVSGEFGTITWQRTPGSATAGVICPYGGNNPRFSAATRFCRLTRAGARWDDPNITSCATSGQVLRRLSQMNITADNAQSVSEDLKTVTSASTNLSASDVNFAVDVLENLARSINEYNNTEVIENAFIVINNLAGAPMGSLVAGQQDSDSVTRIIHLVDEFALHVEFIGDTFEVVTERLDVVVIKINPEVNNGLTFRSVVDENGNSMAQLSYNTTSPDSTAEDPASLELPGSLFEAHRGETDRAQFVLYKDVVFFEVITEASENMTAPTTQSTSTDDDIIARDALNSLVISASLGDLKITGLRDPVKTSFVHQRPERAENPSCVFWDFTAAGGKGSWSTEGCIASQTSEDRTQCECDHLTNFAILMDIYGTTTTYDGDHLLALSIITFAGCTLSILGLIITFFSYIMIRIFKKAVNRKRQLRSDRRTRVLLNLVAALTFMNIFFLTDAVITEFGNPGEVACKLLGALLHYGLLTSIAWMALEAWHMYLALVKVFDSYTSHLMKKMCLVGWGLPAVIVGVVLGVDLDHYDFYNEFCWLRVGGIPFYAAFIAPSLAVILFNFIIFFLVTHQLCSLRRRSVSASSEQFDVSAQLRASLSITVLLGLTWGLGIFMIGGASLVFSYLFAIFNSFQGFCIFVFHCLLKEEVRLGWRKVFCPQCLTLEEMTKSSSGQNFSSSNKQAQLQKRITLEYQVESNGRHHQSNTTPFHPEHEVPRFNPFASNSEFYQDSRI
ncbi:adhesion G-protein coupled receptor G6-like isoform X1 [Lytechinus variegatus]|uniref:adhesion G-protein coupled receptor G6-like isoform X1 n=1 Tax=Lytechinus variegatus TaxID=7654 RepID=UPI001BB277B6|nr:adhesion G-protein coupled receptor G6-like isoform X1 [Lytechinus variegatus]